MTTNYENGDIKLVSCKLTNANKSRTVDIRGQVVSMSIFEDIEQPSIYAEFLMNDGINLVKALPIIGEEELELVFASPFRTVNTKYKFRVFNIKSTASLPGGKGSAYVLTCVSPEHFKASVTNVEKAYAVTADNAVKDILQNVLKTNKSVFVEPAKSAASLVVPKLTVFQAIDFLRQRAVPAKLPIGGVYVFYENQLGYHFRTLEDLLTEGQKTIKSKVFTYSPDVNSDSEQHRASFRNLLRFEHLKKGDTVNKLNAGLYNNVTRSFDLVTKKVTKNSFKLSEQASNFKSGDKKASLPNSDSFVSDFSQAEQAKYFMTKDTSKPNDFLSETAGYRNAFISLFNDNIVRCMVNGDNNLMIGDLITLNIPDSTAGKTNQKNDTRVSGNYLITKLRHLINYENNRFKHIIAFDCNKVGFKL